MVKTISIKDESLAGDVLNEITLKFHNEYITVKDLITQRVTAEVEKYKNSVEEYSHGLVRPTDFEKRINNKTSKSLSIDVEKQIYTALDAFQNNGYFILIDNEQAESLEDKFLIDDQTSVSFVKLTPLIGG